MKTVKANIPFMSRSDIQLRIKDIRTELENRHKYGMVKMAVDGKPIPNEDLQDEMFKLIYRLSKME
jgi:hypothetical protein